jgi:hypothetical protein
MFLLKENSNDVYSKVNVSICFWGNKRQNPVTIGNSQLTWSKVGQNITLMFDSITVDNLTGFDAFPYLKKAQELAEFGDYFIAEFHAGIWLFNGTGNITFYNFSVTPYIRCHAPTFRTGLGAAAICNPCSVIGCVQCQSTANCQTCGSTFNSSNGQCICSAPAVIIGEGSTA